MAQHEVHHHLGAHETSFWPLPVGLGILLLPISLTAYFAWHQQMLGLVLGGFSLLLMVFGLIGWADEFFKKGHEEGFGSLAITLFIATEVIIFGTMFAAFWTARIAHADIWHSWVPKMNFVIPAILTLILWASSFTILVSEKSAESGKRGASILWLLATLILGSAFVVIHFNEWQHLWHEGFTLSSNMYGTGFYALTGIHTSHVLVGLVSQLYVLWLLLSGRMTSHRTTMFKAVSIYWHFVDLMWLLVASSAYIIGGLV
ncbi:MAG: heme-copper oxidase subunit III [Hydrogenobacter thermophilus]|uniref:Cytochrome c oxidase subunit III n=1 Tax=Hydrogenobacter thermophilus (strain DSM 6534 / IAM 12695 / TK-6) TaxID=608538 RepID=D3DHV4_HYDTT|nr:heme-copper oxidase subunit III [Hydrogenobacter thermophilus]ADO45339.1 cytochrome c oxidase subunit III [Hydrogenobacter thermophilus TK-6]QWK19715.1 MAG: heme-copper oxidase subunit III [Hydrogenobacter thermophilus]BAI69406.1 cytochrome c oxidase subunit III [Hydrogenobacter thermophilus TK-6]GBC88013.1 Quinol oxidase subunit 3 [bacterium HR13]